MNSWSLLKLIKMNLNITKSIGGKLRVSLGSKKCFKPLNTCYSKLKRKKKKNKNLLNLSR